MMDVQDVINIVESSSEYKEFIKNNPKNYLAHLFTMMDAAHKDDWQLGYYNKETDKVTVFEYNEGKIIMLPAQEAFKEKNYIAQLKIGEVKISHEEAMKIIDEVLKKNYSAELLIKAIVLLQNLPEYGQIWNITIVTATFNVINVKINATTGEIIKHSKETLIGWKKE